MAYVPVPSTNSSGSTFLGQLQGYKLRRKALDALRPKFEFYQTLDKDIIEARSGKTLRWYRWTNMPAATTAVGEGLVGTSLSVPPAKTIDGTVSQYADFMTFSDIFMQTTPDGTFMKAAEEMGFRAAYTVDNVTRSVIDAESGAAQSAQGTYLNIRDFRAAAMILEGINVPRYMNGLFKAFTHPYTAFDVINDPSANGLADIFKYTEPSKSGTVSTPDRGLMATAANCEITTNTNVLLTSGVPNKWRTYIFGQGYGGTASLAELDVNQINDPNKETFKVMTKQIGTGEISEANPMGTIGGIISYNFTTVSKILEGPSGIGGDYRYRYLDTASSIVA